jgi:hypothetical protein
MILKSTPASMAGETKKSAHPAGNGQQVGFFQASGQALVARYPETILDF